MTSRSGDGNASSQGLVGDNASIPESSSVEQQRQRHQQQHSTTQTQDGRPNQALHAPLPVASSPADMTRRAWTRAELGRQRDAFFDTRVTGAAEVWAALKLVCDMLREGNVKDAQGTLDAAGLTCPTGSVVGGRGRRGGVYDDKGELYDVPGWIVADPADVVEDDVALDKEKAGLMAAEGLGMVEAKAQEQDVEIGQVVKVKARLSGKETDVVVSVGMEQRVGVLVDKIKAKADVKSVRLILFGRMLGENQKLSETGWAPGHVLNAFVFE